MTENKTEKYHTIKQAAEAAGTSEDDVLQAGALGELAIGFYWPGDLLVQTMVLTDKKTGVSMPHPTGGMTVRGFIRLGRNQIGEIWRFGRVTVKGLPDVDDERITHRGVMISRALLSYQEDRGQNRIEVTSDQLLILDADLDTWAPSALTITRLKRELDEARERIADLEAITEQGGIIVDGKVPEELMAAMALYRAVATNPLPDGCKTPRQALEAKVEEFSGGLKRGAPGRLVTVCNWDKESRRK